MAEQLARGTQGSGSGSGALGISESRLARAPKKLMPLSSPGKLKPLGKAIARTTSGDAARMGSSTSPVDRPIAPIQLIQTNGHGEEGAKEDTKPHHSHQPPVVAPIVPKVAPPPGFSVAQVAQQNKSSQISSAPRVAGPPPGFDSSCSSPSNSTAGSAAYSPFVGSTPLFDPVIRPTSASSGCSLGLGGGVIAGGNLGQSVTVQQNAQQTRAGRRNQSRFAFAQTNEDGEAGERRGHVGDVDHSYPAPSSLPGGGSYGNATVSAVSAVQLPPGPAVNGGAGIAAPSLFAYPPADALSLGPGLPTYVEQHGRNGHHLRPSTPPGFGQDLDSGASLPNGQAYLGGPKGNALPLSIGSGMDLLRQLQAGAQAQREQTVSHSQAHPSTFFG